MDLTFLVVVECDVGPFLGEVEEWVGVDRGDNGRDAISGQGLYRIGSDLRDVEPTAQRKHHDRSIELPKVFEGRGEHVHDSSLPIHRADQQPPRRIGS